MLQHGPHHHGDEAKLPGTNSAETTALEPTWSIVEVRTEAECREAARRCGATPIISIDTETYGWLPDKGAGPSPETVGKLALLQLGLPAERQAILVDILALEAAGVAWRDILKGTIEAPTPQKIVHFGLFERAVFERCGLDFDAGVVDTCALARAMWGELQAHHPGLTSKSLKSLAHHLLGKDISKTEQKSDWSLRPLTGEQRAYAALDVEIAADLYLVLERLARTTGLDPNTVAWRGHRAPPGQ